MHVSRGVVALLAAVVTTIGVGAVPAEAARLDLHRGSHGAQVRVLEGRLAELRLLPSSAVDRTYGSATVRSVKRFQRQLHLRATGRVNLGTWNLITREVLRRRPPPPPAARSNPWPAPLVVGHRGAGVPGIGENTLESMRYATASRADVLEFDVRVTSDHELVLLHDGTLEQTTVCLGPVAQRTFDDLRANCPTRQGQKVPTFAEVAAYAASQSMPIAPEIKGVIDRADLEKFVAVIQENGLSSRTSVQSFHAAAVFPPLRDVAHALGVDDLTYVYLGSSSTPTGKVVAVGATTAGLNMSGLTASTVAAYRRAGLRVWTWTVHTSAQLSSLWAMGVDGVITDVPQTARSLFHPS